MVGETGPETVFLPRGSRVQPSSGGRRSQDSRPNVTYAPVNTYPVAATEIVTPTQLFEVVSRSNKQQFEQFTRVMAENGVPLR
jgi:hypothetical protein